MANPVLTQNMVKKFERSYDEKNLMTIKGAILKIGLLFLLLFASSAYSFMLVANGFMDKAQTLSTVGVFGGLIVALVICFSKKPNLYAPLSIVYALLEGLAVGTLSALYAVTSGSLIVINAILATFATLVSMLVLYYTGIIKYTEKFRSSLMVATFGVIIFYVANLIIGLINPEITTVSQAISPLGIIVSIVICIIAALNLIVDFHTIENGSKIGLSKDFEWYGAFALMVTLVWLYIEILNLIYKITKHN